MINQVAASATGVWRLIRNRWLYGLLLLGLGLGSVAMVGPFLWMVASAFKTPAEIVRISPTFLPENPTLKNLIDVLEVYDLGTWLRNSLIVTGSITLLQLFTSSLAGYVFAKFSFRGKEAIFFLILASIMIPFNVIMVPLYLMVVRLHWNNGYLGLIVPWAFSAYGIFLMRQFMHSIPNELIDAARIDGASEFGIYWRIILPLSTPALAALGIFTFIWSWDDLLWPLIIVDDRDLYTMALGLSSFRGEHALRYELMIAGAFYAVIPVLIIYFIAQRRFIEGIAMTGMKG